MQLSHSLKLWSLESNSWLVAFYHRVEIRGFVKLTSLSAEGYLQVHGYSLSSAESVEVISPPGYHNGVLEVSFTSEMPAEIPALEDIERAVGCHSISLPAVYDEVKQYLLQHPESALIHLQQVENPRLGPIMQLLPNVKMGDGFISLGESSYISEHGTEARYSATVHSALDHLVDRHSAGEPLCVVVCGAKNIGKSTLIKYIINKLLKLSKKGVAHLDCDPGQCEFSPPGTLTLHTVTSPLLGPAWYNVPVKVDNSKLYGAMSADIDPDGYLRCVRQLVQQYRSGDTKHLPLLVNTMGWTQGLGLHLLSATVAEVRPTHVIQLCSEGLSYHNFSELSVLNLSSHDMFIPSEISSTMHKFLDYELIPLVMSHIQKLKFESDVLRPILCRDLMTTSYMLKSSRPTSRIVNEITPYRVSMSNIALCFGAEPLPARLWSEAITMQVVVLCSAAPDVVADVEGSAYKTVTGDGAAALSVVGYGLVRAVDDCRQCLYVSTPLSPTHLARVNVLYKLHGSITPEMWFFQQVGWVSDGKGLPFVSKRLSGAGFVSTASAKYKFRKSKN
ncbi:NOL9 [Bugula neritina]|uniref:NOL9 n=1 Tax=Bugula neritina TaxID=10212 RepID=A0A7J7KAX4_BUGNE|nr:NOL9 [Bugula neritina]